MRTNKSGSTTVLTIVCAIIFVFFSFHYIVLFQGDILGMMQYAWSNHETYYNRYIGGSIILGIILIITYLISLSCTFQPRAKALVYMPAMLIMAQITAVDVDDMGNVTMPWSPAWITIVLLIAYPFAIHWLKNNHSPSVLPLDAEVAAQWLSNLVIMLLLMLLTYSIGNTDRNLHTRLTVERLCHENMNAEALAEGIPQYDHGCGITMWRALALSRLEKKDTVKATLLGEKLFSYNIDGAFKSLLPRKGAEPHALLYDCYPVWQSLGFVPRNINEDPVSYINRELRRHTGLQAAKDYLLCTYLLRKDIDTFAHEISKYYDVKASLPRHYLEALTIYYFNPIHQQEMSKDSVNIDNALFEDYSDFQDLLHAKTNNTVKNASLRDNYFGTYWYFYYVKN